MANDRKLFEAQVVTTPLSGRRIAMGGSGTTAQNITVDNFKNWIIGSIPQPDLLHKSFNIGTWSMPSTPEVSVTLTGIARDKIRGIQVMIRSNTNEFFAINHPHSNEEISGSWKINTSPIANAKITLYRKYNYFFDKSGFSGTGNRGYILVTYVP